MRSIHPEGPAEAVSVAAHHDRRPPIGGRGAVAGRPARTSAANLPAWVFTLVPFGVALAVFLTFIVPVSTYDPTDRLPWLPFVVVFALAEVAVAHVAVPSQTVTLSLREIPFVIGLHFVAPSDLVVAQVIGAGLALAIYRRQPPLKFVFNSATSFLAGSIAILVFRAVAPFRPTNLILWWLASFLAMSAFVVVSAVAVAAVISIANRQRELDPLRLGLVFGIAMAFANTSIALVVVVFLHTEPAELWLLGAPALVGLLGYRAFSSQRQRQARLEFLYEWSQLLQSPLLDQVTLGRLLERTREMLRAGVAEVILAGEDGKPKQRIVVEVGRPPRTEPVDGELHMTPDRAATQVGEPGTSVRWTPRRPARWGKAIPMERMVVELVGATDVVGSLMVADRLGDLDAFGSEDLRLLETLGSRLGLNVENSDLVEKLAASLADVTKLAAIVQSSEDAIVAVAPDGKVTAWNPAAGRLFGSSAEEMLGRNVAEVLPARAREALRDAYTEVLGGSAARHIATEWARLDGTSIPVSITVSPIRGPSDEVAGISAIIRDESERARADEAVLVGSEQLRAVIGESPIGMGIADEDLRWSQANQALCALLGIPMDDVVGRPVVAGIHPDDLGTVGVLENHLFDDEEVALSVERRYVDPDGAVLWTSVTARRLRGPADKTPVALITIEDITKRRLVEDETRTTEERFRRAALTMSAIQDPHKVLQAVLESARETVGAGYAVVASYTADGVEMTRWEFDGFHVDRVTMEVGRDMSAVGILAVALGADGPIRLRDVRSHPDFHGFPEGHPVLTSFLAVPIPHESGARATLYLANKIGAEEFTEGDEAIVVALATHAGVCLENARINARSRVLVRDLDQANLELTSANDAKSRFLANVAHELRTPLHAILVAGEMVGDSPVGPLSADQLRDLGATVQRSGRLMVRLIDDLVDLSRIESGRLELRSTLFGLEQLLAEIRPEMARRAAERGITLELPEPPGVRVFADPVRLRQILNNLIGNALKFTEPGGRIRVEATSTRTAIRITVNDTGVGIAAVDLERAFLPFEQVSGAATSGAGLGLAISRSLAELHGGELVATSTPGAGSTFTLKLPRGAAAAARRAQHAAAPVPVGIVGGGRPVLVVEDDLTAMGLVTMVLRLADYQVWSAISVSEARERLAGSIPALVLLDIRLGDGSGLEVVEEMRRSHRLRDVPVLVLSADAMPDDRRRATEAGCNDFLAKPASPRMLLARINELTSLVDRFDRNGSDGASR